jgi:alkylhydroperoxidase family enzyme
MSAPISRYPVPELADLPEDLRTRILEVQAKAGFVPNVFLALAHRPAEWRAFMAYHDALLVKDSGSLSKGEREMIIVATSAVNPLKADIPPRQRAMLAFATKVAQASHEVGEADFAALREHGFDDEDIWDIAAITAFFGLSNRMANVISMRPNDEFYLLGRVPRQK